MKNILITGGAGYIGTHLALDLIDSGFRPILIDNFSNSSILSINLINKLASGEFDFLKGDLLDKGFLDGLFNKYNFDAVIHLAAHKSVSESLYFPLKYYRNNLEGFVNLLNCMESANLKRIVFSSSASIYEQISDSGLKETDLKNPISPYAKTKYFAEEILSDFHFSTKINFISLRYFNPVGAHSSLEIGEIPNKETTNLMPILCMAATGKRDLFYIYGNDYNTPDGTCIRDFIHITDLTSAHLAALFYLLENPEVNLKLNIGTGKGISVLGLVQHFEKVNNCKINVKFEKRRDGDVAACFADPALSISQLKWKAKKDISQMCFDSYNWQVKLNKITRSYVD